MRRLLRRFLGLPEPLRVTNPPVAASAPPFPEERLARMEREAEELRADLDVLRRHVKQVRGMITGGLRKSDEDAPGSTNGKADDLDHSPQVPDRFIGPWLRTGARA